MNVYMIVCVEDGDVDLSHYWTEEARDTALADLLLPHADPEDYRAAQRAMAEDRPLTGAELLDLVGDALDFDVTLREIDTAQIDDAEQLAPHLRTFRVCITRGVTESVFLDVVAMDADAAQDAAWDRLRASDVIEWELDAGSWNNSDAYVSDVEEVR